MESPIEGHDMHPSSADLPLKLKMMKLPTSSAAYRVVADVSGMWEASSSALIDTSPSAP